MVSIYLSIRLYGILIKILELTIYLGIYVGGRNRFDVNQGSLKRDGEAIEK